MFLPRSPGYGGYVGFWGGMHTCLQTKTCLFYNDGAYTAWTGLLAAGFCDPIAKAAHRDAASPDAAVARRLLRPRHDIEPRVMAEVQIDDDATLLTEQAKLRAVLRELADGLGAFVGSNMQVTGASVRDWRNLAMQAYVAAASCEDAMARSRADTNARNIKLLNDRLVTLESAARDICGLLQRHMPA